MNFDILTLFPGMFSGPFDESIIRRGKDKQLIDIALHNIPVLGTGKLDLRRIKDLARERAAALPRTANVNDSGATP